MSCGWGWCKVSVNDVDEESSGGIRAVLMDDLSQLYPHTANYLHFGSRAAVSDDKSLRTNFPDSITYLALIYVALNVWKKPWNAAHKIKQQRQNKLEAKTVGTCCILFNFRLFCCERGKCRVFSPRFAMAYAVSAMAAVAESMWADSSLGLKMCYICTFMFMAARTQ